MAPAFIILTAIYPNTEGSKQCGGRGRIQEKNIPAPLPPILFPTY